MPIPIEKAHVIVKKDSYDLQAKYIFESLESAENHVIENHMENVEILDVEDWNYIAYKCGHKEN